MSRNQLRALAALAALVAVVLVALPVLGVDPSPSPSAELADPSSAPESVEPSAEASESEAPASAEPEPVASSEPEPEDSPAPAAEPEENEQGNGGKPDKAAKPDKGPKAPEHPVTLTGTVGREPGEDGDYTLVVGINVYTLSAGPKWWWGDADPLAGSVGKIVTVDGEQAEGSDEVDVLAIDGAAIRAAGKPPWAGGWKVVGEKHPGWAQWKVDKLNSREAGHGRDNAPGQLKKDDAAP
ncbi:MAG TPA: hypothetical protein VFO05_12660 [Candidatus Limnocylindrales bacterium]|nr:hypothetical protein [Candidatus Limnocylindrales bacterium]